MSFKTAWLVRMIISVTVGMKWLIFVFSLSILAFSNTFLILSRMNSPAFIGKDGIWEAIKYSYRAGIGDFNTADVPTSGIDNILIYSIWMLSTFINLIVLLNAVIAIISDIFDKVYENMNKNLLKELVVLMAESELLISRKGLFKDKKYIVIIERETGETGKAENDTKIGIIKHHMSRQIKTQDGLIEKIENNIQNSLYKKIMLRSEEIEVSTEKKLELVNHQLESLDLNLKHYQDLMQKISSQVD